MLLNDIAETSAQVTSHAGRRAKVDQIARLLARTRPDEVPIAVAFLSGELRQRQIGVGYATLQDLLPARPPAAARSAVPTDPGPVTAGPGPVTAGPSPVTAGPGPVTASPSPVTAGPSPVTAGPGPMSADPGPPATKPALTIGEADEAFTAIGRISGSGSQAQRRRLLADLFARATASERAFLIQLLAGELRQGALEGVMVEAVAQAAAVPAAEVRRALMLGGSLPAVARAALCGSALSGSASGAGPDTALAALRSFTLQVGRPMRPMLAASAASIEAALQKVSPAAIEWKIDGIRVQVHKDGPRVAVFTRTLEEVTDRLPEITEAVAALPATTVVLDGEAVALRPDRRPQPFQITASRTGSRLEVAARREDVPLTVFFFDLLHLDGKDLIDRPARDRYAELARLLPPGLVIPRTVTADPVAAEAFFADAVARGHEGVVLKSLDAPYAAGRRGAEWIKVKPRHTLDLVILAAEWGHGRRRGWLSNLHLGARDPVRGSLVMLGKTFKGLTDEMLAWQTGRLLELAEPGQDRTPENPRDARGVVRVRPELVAEIAFDGVQTSRRYPGGLALRFARVIRYRPDKRAADADTIDTVRDISGITAADRSQ